VRLGETELGLLNAWVGLSSSLDGQFSYGEEDVMSMNSAHLSAFLRDNHVDGEIVRLSQHAATVEAAAEAVGVPPDCIVKSVVLLIDSSPALAIANGLSRIDLKVVADYLELPRKRVKLADAPTVLELTGFGVGGVPPFGHRVPLRTLIDPRVLGQSEVYAGGGEAEVVLRTTPAEIVRVTNAEVVPLTGKE